MNYAGSSSCRSMAAFASLMAASSDGRLGMMVGGFLFGGHTVTCHWPFVPSGGEMCKRYLRYHVVGVMESLTCQTAAARSAIPTTSSKPSKEAARTHDDA
jgi:hypothetical protein